MLILTVINLYTVRWVLGGLGIVDYGIFNAIAGVVTISASLSSVLALSTQRFYSYSIGTNDSTRLRDIFSVSLNLVLFLSLLIIVFFEIFGPWYISSHMQIPIARVSIVLMVFHISLAAVILGIIQIPFMGAVFAHEHMGTYALISTIDCILKLLIAIFMSYSKVDHLLFYTAALLVVCLVITCLYIGVALINYPECRYRKIWRKELYFELFSFSGWSFYGTLSSAGMIQGNTVLLNVFFGPIVNAAFGIANQTYNALNTLGNSIVLAFRPAMIKSYSANDFVFLDRLFNFSNKLILYLLMIIIIPFLFEAKYILTLWLGEDKTTDTMVLFTKLFAIHCVCLSLHNPITTIIQAIGRIKYYSMVVETLTIMCVPVSWLLFRMGFPSYWVFVSLISLSFLAHISRVMFLKKYYTNFRISLYITGFVVPAILVVGLTLVIVYFIYTSLNETFLNMLVVFLCSTIIMTFLIIVVGIDQQERRQLVRFCHGLFR